VKYFIRLYHIYGAQIRGSGPVGFTLDDIEQVLVLPLEDSISREAFAHEAFKDNNYVRVMLFKGEKPHVWHSMFSSFGLESSAVKSLVKRVCTELEGLFDDHSKLNHNVQVVFDENGFLVHLSPPTESAKKAQSFPLLDDTKY